MPPQLRNGRCGVAKADCAAKRHRRSHSRNKPFTYLFYLALGTGRVAYQARSDGTPLG